VNRDYCHTLIVFTIYDAVAALVDADSYEGDTLAPYTEGSGAGLLDNEMPSAN